MGADIMIYAEKKVNGKWEFFMPQCNFSNSNTGYCHDLDVGGRVPALFQILSKFYGDEYFDKDFKTISDNRGIAAATRGYEKWLKNRQALIMGSPESGKSRTFLKPSEKTE